MTGTQLRATPKSRHRHYVREWRLSRGMNQDRLAELISLTPGAVSQLENGTVGYSQRGLEAIADVFGCSPADLLDGPPDANSEFLTLWRRLLPERREIALAVLSAIVKLEKGGER